MHIIASDYDGTLCANRQLIGDVLPAVKRWRAQGNIFGIATGRDLPMILTETDKWDIPYDFLVCMNGAAVYDKNRNLLTATNLPDDLPGRLMRHPAGMASMHYQLSGTEPLRVLEREGTWFPKLGIPYTVVDFEEALALRNLCQLSLAYTTVEECDRWHDLLLRDFDGEIAAHNNKTTMDINLFGVDKAAGIEEILRRNGWPADNVHTIGDGGNDIGMIKRFGGFTVPDATEEVTFAAKRIFPDVPSMMAHFTAFSAQDRGILLSERSRA